MIIRDYGYVLVYLVAAVAFAEITLLVSRLAAPRRPYKEKNATYECGEPPVGEAWVRFNISYYIFALIFVVFDVESIFIYPWAVVFKSAIKAGNGGFMLFEMAIFIFVLILGLAYAWRKGVLKWV